jgi:hypothetical protein
MKDCSAARNSGDLLLLGHLWEGTLPADISSAASFVGFYVRRMLQHLDS